MQRQSNQKTAFILTGGGSLGAIQVGMLKALTEQNIKADLLVGSSVGAINAAYFAAEPTSQGVEKLEKVWQSLRRQDVFHFSLIGGILGLIGKRTHLFDVQRFKFFLSEHLPYRYIEESTIPLHIVASELISGNEVVLSKGSAINALQASSAIPGIFPPVKINGSYLLDGGVANHTPITTAIELGASRLIVLPTGFTCAPKEIPSGALDMALHALNIIIARQLIQDLEQFKGKVEIAVVPSLCPQETHPLNFDRASELIAEGELRTRSWLDGGGLSNETSFAFLMPHEH